MKVTAFVGSGRKKHTYEAAEKFLAQLKSRGGIDTEIVRLSEFNIGVCMGCKQCLDRGEERCPMKDDRDVLIGKMDESDGILFATPNYSFNVSGLMKVFLDRIGFLFHRPRYFGKTMSSLVPQGVFRGQEIVRYFNFIGKGLGFNVVRGRYFRTLEPMTDKDLRKRDRIIDDLSRKFYRQLIKRERPVPSLFDLIIFRWSRSAMKKMLNEEFRDYVYYTEKGWFDAPYYYPVKLNPLKKAVGRMVDRAVSRGKAAN